MKPKKIKLTVIAAILFIFTTAWTPFQLENSDPEIQSPESGRYLYVAVPGIRNYLGYGGHGILVFDMDKDHSIIKKVGPFSNGVRPFTINSQESLVFANVDDLLGFEVGDLKTGEVLHSIVVEGWEKGPVRRHGNPSHGVGLTPDEKELWVCDGHNMRMHVFSALPPYQQLTTIPVQDMPGWITFSLDGKYAYPSSGEVIDVKTRNILMTLKDEFHNYVASEKMVEIHFSNHQVVKAGDQFGIGRAEQ